MQILKFEHLAKNIAKKSSHKRYHYGCILFKKNKILSFGYNLLKTHPKSPHPFKHIHAEFHCLLGVPDNDIKDSSIYIYMERIGTETKGISKPCKDCEKMLRNAGVRKVIYFDGNKYLEEEL